MTTSQNQVSEPERRAGFAQAARWLAANVGRPAAANVSSYSARASHRATIYYRRATTRAAGLVLNSLDSLVDKIPGRA